MNEYLIFYRNFKLKVNNSLSNVFDYFDYDKRYEIIESYETREWDEYHSKVSLGNGKSAIIYYHYDGKDLYDKLVIEDGLLIEYSYFPSYEFIEIDIQEERNKKINKILNN
jgi:hypothetical protein